MILHTYKHIHTPHTYIHLRALTCEHLRLREQLQDASAANVSIVEIFLHVEVFLESAVAVLGGRRQSGRDGILLIVPYKYVCMVMVY